jgi:hypothetical protein
MLAHRGSRRAIRWLLLAFNALFAIGGVTSTYAARPTSLGFPVSEAEYEGVQRLADGSLQLDPAAPAPAALLGNFAHYGFYIAPPQRLDQPLSHVRATYEATAPLGSAVAVDLRGSPDGKRWLPWEVALATGDVVAFNRPVQLIQFRVRLFGNTESLPSIADVAFDAEKPPADYQSTAETIAPTWRIRATRQGMIGGRTANGHIITPRDRFVSLPSWSVLSSKGGHEYQVRLSYNGRSSVVPVYDVGPYNTRDDYWDYERDKFQDLPRGWPEDHAAYYEGYNGGYGDKGYVRFPTAVDVGDGAWWDDLGIVGDQAELEITFLWMGRDPHELHSQSTVAAGSDIVVDELGPMFSRSVNLGWFSSGGGCGEGRHALYMPTVGGKSKVHGIWKPNLPAEGLYDVYVHVPLCPARYAASTRASYIVQHRDGAQEVVINQETQVAWVYLGRFPFLAGKNGTVALNDATGEERRVVWLDSARWVPVR